jgi:hypothetical protein
MSVILCQDGNRLQAAPPFPGFRYSSSRVGIGKTTYNTIRNETHVVYTTQNSHWLKRCACQSNLIYSDNVFAKIIARLEYIINRCNGIEICK